MRVYVCVFACVSVYVCVCVYACVCACSCVRCVTYGMIRTCMQGTYDRSLDTEICVFSIGSAWILVGGYPDASKQHNTCAYTSKDRKNKNQRDGSLPCFVYGLFLHREAYGSALA